MPIRFKLKKIVGGRYKTECLPPRATTGDKTTLFIYSKVSTELRIDKLVPCPYTFVPAKNIYNSIDIIMSTNYGCSILLGNRPPAL